MSKILVLGGAGEMGSVAVRDLATHTDHDIVIGDLDPKRAAQVLRGCGRPERTVRVDVSHPDELASALAGVDVVLNATLMRYTVTVTDAAIAAGVHLVDLGAYYDDTLMQLDRHVAAKAAGCRIVPGCGVAPGLTNILVAEAARQLDQVLGVEMYSYITHPMYTSPGLVVTRFDASTGRSVVMSDGNLVERPSFGDQEIVEFPAPYGKKNVHLVPHPEVVTLPRHFPMLRDVVFKVGYTADEISRIDTLLALGFDSDEPFAVGDATVSPRRFAAAWIGRSGLSSDERTANVKRVFTHGTRDGVPATVRHDFAVEHTGTSASSVITGTAAAVAADLVVSGGSPGVLPPEAGLDSHEFLRKLAERGLTVDEATFPRCKTGRGDHPHPNSIDQN